MNFKVKFNILRPQDLWNALYKYTYTVQKLNKCASSHFLLPGSTIDQVLCAAPFFSLAVPPDIHIIYHGFECSITAGLFLFSRIIHYSCLSNWTLLEFHSTISLIWPFSCILTRLPYIYHNLNRLLYAYHISNIYKFFISYSLLSLLLSYYIILILPGLLYFTWLAWFKQISMISILFVHKQVGSISIFNFRPQIICQSRHYLSSVQTTAKPKLGPPQA